MMHALHAVNKMFIKLHFLFFLNGHNIEGALQLNNDCFKIIIWDILFMRSHEARPSTVPPKLELWKGLSLQLSLPVKT